MLNYIRHHDGNILVYKLNPLSRSEEMIERAISWIGMGFDPTALLVSCNYNNNKSISLSLILHSVCLNCDALIKLSTLRYMRALTQRVYKLFFSFLLLLQRS